MLNHRLIFTAVITRYLALQIGVGMRNTLMLA